MTPILAKPTHTLYTYINHQLICTILYLYIENVYNVYKYRCSIILGHNPFRALSSHFSLLLTIIVIITSCSRRVYIINTSWAYVKPTNAYYNTPRVFLRDSRLKQKNLQVFNRVGPFFLLYNTGHFRVCLYCIELSKYFNSGA